MQGLELEVTWRRVLSVFWLFTWRAFVGAILLGFVIGFPIGFVGGMLGVTIQAVKLTSGVAGAIVGIAWSFLVVRMVLRKKYKEFRIVLVANS